MDKMLYVAMTGASQNARAQQAHANNLAKHLDYGVSARFRAGTLDAGLRRQFSVARVRDE